MTNTLGPKDPEEIKVLRFPFASQLESGASISSAQVSIAAVSGTDATPGAVLLGSAVLAGTDVLQRVQGGLHGVTYDLRVKATDSTGLVHMLSGLLQVAWA